MTNTSTGASDPLWASYWKHIQDVGPLTHTRYRLVLAEIPTLPPKPRILDVGCGNGTLLELLARRFPDASLMGVEPSQEACSLASSSIASRIHRCSLSEFAVDCATQFDLITCSEVLEHIDDPLGSLSLIAELLNEGGIAIFTVPSGMKYWSIQDDAAGHLRRFEPAEFMEMLRQSSFQVLNLYTWGGPISALYNKMVNTIGPQSAASSSRSIWVRLLARLTTQAMHIDDLFKSPRHTRFQLVASAARRKEDGPLRTITQQAV